MAAKREIIITTGLLAIVGGSAFLSLRPVEIPAAQNALERQPIRVSVAGEVTKPGVYTLPWGSRAEAALKAAGGTTANAELSLLNPAQILGDGEQVRVPSKFAQAAPSTTQKTTPALPSGERINLNTAPQAQLENLPGVGPKMAARIIAARPLQSSKDLDAVSGIGPSMLKKLEPLVRY